MEEDLTTMTIESLRTRLLSERTISRSATQRADDLAKRVVELEEQLKIVSIQRKKAERATADVLAILESNGMSDASDAHDSSSVCESNESGKKKDGLNDSREQRIEHDTYSSSEIESSSTAGSIESIRRRCSSFVSNGSKHKHLSKSCRRIRRRETRALRNDNIRVIQEDSVEAYHQEPGKHKLNDVTETLVSYVPVITNLSLGKGHDQDKFKENNRHVFESSDLDRTIMSKDRDEIRVQNEFVTDQISSPNQETLSVAMEMGFSFKQEVLATSPDTPQFHNGQKQDKKNESISGLNSSSDFTRFPPSYVANGESSRNLKEFITSMPKKSSNDLGSVLDALQLAKLSLRHKLEDGFSVKDSIPMTKTSSIIEMPVGYPSGLLSSPGFGNYLRTDSTLSSANRHDRSNSSDTSSRSYYYTPQYIETGSRTYTNATPPIELRSSIPPIGISSSFSTRNIGFAPILDDNQAFRTERPTYFDTGYPFSSKYTYPSYPSSPDVTPQLSSSGSFSRDARGVELGMMPSIARFSLNGNQIRPNLYK